MSSSDERLVIIEKLVEKVLLEQQKIERPTTCIFCVVRNRNKQYDISKSAWLIASDLVIQYCKEKGLKACDHNNEWLTNESIQLADKISNLLEAKSNNRYNSLELFKVLGDYLDEDNVPVQLQKIINTVGKNWIKSLNLFDYDFGYLAMVKEHGEGVCEGLMVPPNHPNMFRTQREWAKVCDCDECQEYWVIKNKEIEEAEKKLG